MPIKPPKLDDRTYEDIVREARALIPQYCPEWTHLGDSDPGMTLVQLFAWMTEMTLYRLNRVPDKTYIHFLNFIGEERRAALPSSAWLTFSPRVEDRTLVEMPAHTRCSTRQRDGGDALHFLSAGELSAHGGRIERIVAVRAGPEPRVREIPSRPFRSHPQALELGDGTGVRLFHLDATADGPDAYTPDQWLYLRHDDFGLMADLEAEVAGRLRIRSDEDAGLPVAALFDWEHPVGGEQGWAPIAEEDTGRARVRGLPESLLRAHLPGMVPLTHLGDGDAPIPLPAALAGDTPWIRGRLRYERWLAERMVDELEISWQDDRGGDERVLANWVLRHVGRSIELFVEDLPPVRGGWTVRLTLVDHGLAAGRSGLFPGYRWSYRRGDRWMEIPSERVELLGASFVLTGPLTDMATDGYNLRAERVESVAVERLVPGLLPTLTWRRPIEVVLASGPDRDGAVLVEREELPREPFQAMASLPPLLGMKLYVGADLLLNREHRAVMLELEIGFERAGEPVEEPVDDYRLQLTYRSATGWRVVHAELFDFSEFTFATLDPEGAATPGRRRIRLELDPVTQLAGLTRSPVAGREAAWLRFELTRAALSHQPEPSVPPIPVSLRLFSAALGLAGALGREEYDEPMPGVRAAVVEHRPGNPRFTRLVHRDEGEVRASWPFDDFIATAGDDHRALYLRFDKPLPVARRLATLFRARGETWLPTGFSARWEALQGSGSSRRWTRLDAGHDEDPDAGFGLDRTGVLSFPLREALQIPDEGTWIRGVFRTPPERPFPALPPVTHILPNTVEAVNLHGFRMEKFSGLGVPHQAVQLRRFPLYVPDDASRDSAIGRHADLHVSVEEEDGERRAWRPALGNSFATASKDDRVFVVDAVEGTLTFGNGLRGRIVPIGSYNVVVESYHTVPGMAGNVGPEEVALSEAYGDLLEVSNLLPATGGRDAESIDEIIRRAPSVLTSRDRAVTRHDFEILAEEASGEVARAACGDGMGEHGEVPVVILPRRRPGEEIPDPFLSASLAEHVQRHLSRRCLVNVRPTVTLAEFAPVDVEVSLRLTVNANFVTVREQAEAWVRRFLDPYAGGLDGEGWPFGGTLYAQDFGRMVVDLPDVRHVVGVRLFRAPDLSRGGDAGWEQQQGTSTLSLDHADLFAVRHVRIVWEDADR